VQKEEKFPLNSDACGWTVGELFDAKQLKEKLHGHISKCLQQRGNTIDESPRKIS